MMTSTQIETLVAATLRALPDPLVIDSVRAHLEMLTEMHEEDVADAQAHGFEHGPAAEPAPTVADAVDSFLDDFHGWGSEQEEWLEDMFAQILATVARAPYADALDALACAMRCCFHAATARVTGMTLKGL